MVEVLSIKIENITRLEWQHVTIKLGLISSRTGNLNGFRVNDHAEQHIAFVPNAESGTNCPKITTPQYRCSQTFLTLQSNVY